MKEENIVIESSEVIKDVINRLNDSNRKYFYLIVLIILE